MSNNSPMGSEAGADKRHAQYTSATANEDVRAVLLNQISWGAVFAGVVIALIVQFLLTLLGVAIGAATVDMAGGNNPAASTFSIIGAVWYALSGIVSAFAGGFVSSRLSGKPLATSGALHGLTTWAVTTLVILFLITTAIGGLVGGAMSGLSSFAGGLGNTAAGAVSTAAPMLGNADDPFAAIEQKLSAVTGSASPEDARKAAMSAVKAAVSGSGPDAEQARQDAAQALARVQNIPVEQASQQIDQYKQQYEQTMEQAKAQAVKTADAAATVASRGASVAFVVLILGALAAWFGGKYGVVTPLLARGTRRD